MSDPLVIDASVAIKWVIEEDGTAEALALRDGRNFVAPDLLVAECANILWKKTQRKELTAAEASIAAALIQRADIALVPMLPLIVKATEIAISIAHPAYDCIYLALAAEKGWRFVTADARLLTRLQDRASSSLFGLCVGLKSTSIP